LNPEEDPSQFSCQVSELALVSALNALRFSQVVLMVIDGTLIFTMYLCVSLLNVVLFGLGNQGKFNKIDLQLAEKYVTVHCFHIY
jgi:hypothetical protein